MLHLIKVDNINGLTALVLSGLGERIPVFVLCGAILEYERGSCLGCRCFIRYCKVEIQ